jgi:O-antigen/teichoic acid export membrane protein
MKAHLTNAAYGVLDYAAYPVGMLLVAPIVLHRLGIAEYGIWTVATATVSTGGIIASGFGDANIQHVAQLRSSESEDKRALENAVRCMIGINLALGTLLALAGWALAPAAARHLAASNLAQQPACLLALRIASVLMLVRALESVSISTQRAFERYGAAVRISIAGRLLTLVAAAVLAYTGHGTASIMAATAVVMVLGTLAQFLQLHKFLGGISFLPAFDSAAAKALFGFGIFSWLQAVAGVMFGQVDRLLLGVSLGATAVASYALCVQLAQPIFGLTAAGLHFLFPYLSGRLSTFSSSDLKQTLLRAFACNLLFVAAGTGLLLAFGETILRAWAGAAVAQIATPIFPLIVIGSALLGLSVTGTYALLALGRVRIVTWLSITGGTIMLLTMWWLLPHHGVHGLAVARLGYGAFSLALYVPLIRSLLAKTPAPSAAPLKGLGTLELEEVSRA